MMKKLIASSLAITACSLSLQAGHATFSGEGYSAPREPEFFTINVEVSSICYAKPLEAQTANDTAVAQIQAELEEYINPDSNIDKLLTNGGNTERYEHHYYEGNIAKTICQGTFKKTTRISLKTGDLAKISSNFSQIQQIILSSYTRENESIESPTTSVTISAPVAGICPETISSMRKEALKEAVLNAKEQFIAAASACGVKGQCQVDEFSTSTDQIQYRGYEKSARSVSSSPTVNLNFEPFVESAKVEVKFSYPQTYFTICQKK